MITLFYDHNFLIELFAVVYQPLVVSVKLVYLSLSFTDSLEHAH
jgi:hypothetical protein